jgi:uncharacterized C2H2 Zn-finger protein
VAGGITRTGSWRLDAIFRALQGIVTGINKNHVYLIEYMQRIKQWRIRGVKIAMH